MNRRPKKSDDIIRLWRYYPIWRYLYTLLFICFSCLLRLQIGSNADFSQWQKHFIMFPCRVTFIFSAMACLYRFRENFKFFKTWIFCRYNFGSQHRHGDSSYHYGTGPLVTKFYMLFGHLARVRLPVVWAPVNWLITLDEITRRIISLIQFFFQY